MKKILILIFTLSQITHHAIAQSEYEYKQAEYIWDLTEIYKTQSGWVQDYEQVKKLVHSSSFTSLSFDLTASSLKELLDDISLLRTKVSKVAYYAILKWEEGKADNGEELLEKGEYLLADFEATLTGVEQQIGKIGTDKLSNWLQTNKGLFKHRHWLNLIIDQSKYRAHPAAESTLRSVNNWIASSIDTYWELQAIEALWPKYVDKNGKEVRLNRTAYRKLRRSSDLAYKTKGAQLYYAALQPLSDVMANLYIHKIKAEKEMASLRNFKDGIDANWFLYGGVPEGGYKIMLQAAKANKHVLQRYAKLRAKMLKLDKLRYLDFYTKPTALDKIDFDFNKSMHLAYDASQKLGDSFADNMKIALSKKNWMHLADVPKTANYHVRPPSGEIHPYFILKYQPNMLRSRTLVGGLFDLASSIPGIGADGTDVLENPASSIYGNGFIYVGDLLHDEALVESIEDIPTRRAVLLESLEFLRTFFRHAIHTELDAAIQAMVSEGQIPDGQQVSEAFLKILRDYYGHDSGIMDIPDYMQYDWMTETYVLFLPKYEHQFWAPAIATAAALIEKAKSGDNQVKKLLQQDYSAGKYDAYSVLKSGGIDLMDSQAYDFLFERMNKIMDKINKLENLDNEK